MGNKEVGIYLINKRKFKELKNNEDIVAKLKEEMGEDYKEIALENEIIDGYNIKLYNRISYSKDTWNTFWNCKINNDKINIADTPANNFVAFIYKKNNIFCVTSNRAYHDINKYVVYFFGVCIMSYFIRDDDKIRSATYSNIMSDFLGGSEYLGEEYQATVDKYWDRINTNLMAELDKERIFKEFGLENKRKINKVRCDAKDNFTICSKIDINQLITIIKKLDDISTNELIDKFNTIERIKEEDLEEKLTEQLVKKIYADYKEDKLDVCIVHKNIDKFFSSMSYCFMYNTENQYLCDTVPNNKDLKNIFDELNISSEEKVREAITKIQLICFDANGNVELSDNLDYFINMAIEYNNKEYLIQNKIWYELTDNYINNLNKVFKFIKNGFEEQNIEFKEWKNENEGRYIDLYNGLENFYKIHPKLEDGIEICDLMYIDKENEQIKMLFLKDGFGTSTRDLSIQIVMGVKRFLSIIKDEEKIDKFYKKYIKEKSPKYSYEDFKKEIITFSKNAVMVYKLPEGNKEASNIGKQSVIFAKNAIEMLGTCKFTIKQL
jgi:uncharacterized protein (TIGR04141 family)